MGDGRAGVTKTGGLTKKRCLCFPCFLCSDPEERSDLSTTEPAKMNECENGQSFLSPLLMIAVNNSHLPRQALDVTHERKNARRTIRMNDLTVVSLWAGSGQRSIPHGMATSTRARLPRCSVRGRNATFAMPFMHKMYRFTKTGSGQTWGKHPKTKSGCVFLRRLRRALRSQEMDRPLWWCKPGAKNAGIFF